MPAVATTARAVFALGAGLGAIVFGTCLAPPGATVGLAATIAGVTLTGIGGNVAAADLYDRLKDGVFEIANVLRAAASKGRLPVNHDLARAIRRSHLNAFRVILKDYADRTSSQLDDGGVRKFTNAGFIDAAHRWLDRKLDEVNKEEFFSGVTVESSIAEITSLIDGVARVNPNELLSRLGRSAAEAAYHEFKDELLRSKIKFPDDFKRAFDGAQGRIRPL